MAEYKTIKGFKVQSYATDPQAATAAWSSGNNMNTARQFVGSVGAQDAGLIAGGETTVEVKIVEEYNGTSWTEVNDLLATKYNTRGFGNSTEACYMVGGRDPNTADMEEYNGTSWTEANNLPATTNNGIAVGPSSSGLYALGYNGGYVAETYEWNGTSWTHTVDANTGRVAAAATGTQTAALAFGGNDPGTPTSEEKTESYNGTSWTNVNDLNTGRKGLGGSSFGILNTLAFAFGGEERPGSPNSLLTESWDGTSWTEVADLSTSNVYGGGVGTVTNALSAGGQGLIATTEEWNDYSGTNPAPSLTMLNEGQIWYNTTGNALKYTGLGTGTWASAPALNTGVQKAAGLGIQDSALCVSGESTDKCEKYNGTTWTEVNNVLALREQASSSGTTTSGLFFGGAAPGGVTTANESWDGTSWSEENNLNTARRGSGGSGPSDAAAVMSTGYTTANVANVETWNGTSWAEANNVNTARRTLASGGASSTAAIIAGGYEPGANSAKAESWDGTCWAEVASINTARDYIGGAPTTDTAGLAFGSPGTTPTGITEYYNGSTWTEVGDMSTKGMRAPAGTSTAALAAGAGPGSSTATEEWILPIGIKTVTLS